ncbi:hypothetical protein SMICM304S_01273 [Streptomyces microflavus]
MRASACASVAARFTVPAGALRGQPPPVPAAGAPTTTTSSPRATDRCSERSARTADGHPERAGHPQASQAPPGAPGPCGGTAACGAGAAGGAGRVSGSPGGAVSSLTYSTRRVRNTACQDSICRWAKASAALSSLRAASAMPRWPPSGRS